MRAGFTGIELVRTRLGFYPAIKDLQSNLLVLFLSLSLCTHRVWPAYANRLVVLHARWANCVNVSSLVRYGNFDYLKGEFLDAGT